MDEQRTEYWGRPIFTGYTNVAEPVTKLTGPLVSDHLPGH